MNPTTKRKTNPAIEPANSVIEPAMQSVIEPTAPSVIEPAQRVEMTR